MAVGGGKVAKDMGVREIGIDGRVGASGGMEDGCSDGGYGGIARVGRMVVTCRWWWLCGKAICWVVIRLRWLGGD